MLFLKLRYGACKREIAFESVALRQIYKSYTVKMPIVGLGRDGPQMKQPVFAEWDLL